MLQAGDAARAERGRYPRTILALGATYGTTQFRSLTGPITALLPSTETRSSVVVGGLFTYVAPSEGAHLTVEVPLLFKSSYRASGPTARWCLPAGSVVGKTGRAAAQSCEEQPLGAPVHQGQAWVAVLLGAATERGAARFAAGPTFAWDVASPATPPYQIGVQMPFYLRVMKNLAGYSGDFDGFVRVVPSFAVGHTDKGPAPVGMTTVELIGKRGMFGSGLYWP